jgi:hypothetical protein
MGLARISAGSPWKTSEYRLRDNTRGPCTYHAETQDDVEEPATHICE